jgi:ABC-type Fe3+ transport system substrate-binding protein
MGKNLALLAAVIVVVIGPILMRPKGDEAMLKGQDNLAIITPHNEAIRSEFSEAFREWYRAKTGRTVVLEWFTPGGTSETTLYLNGAYTAAFENYWRRTLGRKWENEVEAGILDPRTEPAKSPDDDTPRQAARRAFLDSNVGGRLDVFFGGGSYDFIKMASVGLLVDCGYVSAHPEIFGPGKPIPPVLGGEPFYDEKGRWIGTTLGAFGIAYNRDQIARLGVPDPHRWSDMADPRYFRATAMANPVQSGSANKALEMLVQQQMNIVAAEPGADEARITSEGWTRAMRLLQRIGANARYFTDSSSKIALDVEAGEAAAGMTIDFYGRFQSETVRRADGSSRIGYTDAQGGTSYGTDPIGLLRGAPHPELGRQFIEFVMTDGQKLWGWKAGVGGGPKRRSLRRLPMLPHLYGPEFRALRSDPDVLPYEAAKSFTYVGKRTAPLFATIAFVVRVMCIDTHHELTAAWRELFKAKERTGSFPPEALAAFEDVRTVDYAAASTSIRKAIGGGESKIMQVQLAKELADNFRANYRRAAELARAGR